MQHITHCLVLLVAALPIGARGQCTGTTVVLWDNDFELTDGGLVESDGLDWEWGVIPTMLIDTAECSTLAEDPPGAYSGTKGWGTVLNGCYNSLGMESTVSFTVDLSNPNFTSADLKWQQWWDVFVNFDYMTVRANGTTIFFNDTAQNSVGWETTIVNLNAFLGDPTVELSFSLHATVVVNYAGWYLDDIHVSACEQGPAAMGEVDALTMRISPNPAGDRAVLTLPASIGSASLELFNAQGGSMRTMPVTGSRVQIERGELPAGVYSVAVRGADGSHYRGRFVFQ